MGGPLPPNPLPKGELNGKAIAYGGKASTSRTCPRDRSQEPEASTYTFIINQYVQVDRSLQKLEIFDNIYFDTNRLR